MRVSSPLIRLFCSLPLFACLSLEGAVLSFSTNKSEWRVDGLSGSLPYERNTNSGIRIFPEGEFEWKLALEDAELSRSAKLLHSYSITRDHNGNLWVNGRLPFNDNSIPWNLDLDSEWLVIVGWESNGQWQTGTVIKHAHEAKLSDNSLVFSFRASNEKPPIGPLTILAYVNGTLAPKADNPLKAEFENNNTTLHRAALKGQTHFILTAIEKRSKSLKTQNRFGETPLMLATRNGRLPIVHALLESGINPNKKNRYGKTIVDLAIESGHADALELILQYANPGRKKWSSLMSRATQENESVLSTLIHSQAPITFPINDGHIHYLNILKAGYFELAEQFRKRFDVSPMIDDVDFRFEHAIALANVDGVAEQIKESFDFTVKTKDGQTPIDLAIESANQRFLASLVTKRPDLLTESLQIKIWDIAIRKNALDLAEQLSTLGGAKRKTDTGATLPMRAILASKQNLAQILFKRGSRWNFDSPELEKAMAICFREDYSSFIQFAIEQGIEWKSSLADGLSPELLADYYQSPKIGAILGLDIKKETPTPSRPKPVSVTKKTLDIPDSLFAQLGAESFQISAILCKDGFLRYPYIQDVSLPAPIENYLLKLTQVFRFGNIANKNISLPMVIGIDISLKRANEDQRSITIDEADDPPRLINRIEMPQTSTDRSEVRLPSTKTTVSVGSQGQTVTHTTSSSVPIVRPRIPNGRARLNYRISETGNVEDIKINGSLTESQRGKLHNSLTNAKYLPGRINGIAVAISAEASIDL